MGWICIHGYVFPLGKYVVLFYTCRCFNLHKLWYRFFLFLKFFLNTLNLFLKFASQISLGCFLLVFWLPVIVNMYVPAYGFVCMYPQE